MYGRIRNQSTCLYFHVQHFLSKQDVHGSYSKAKSYKSNTVLSEKEYQTIPLFHVSLYFAYIMNGLPNYIQGLVSIPVVPNKLLTTIIEGWNSLTEAYNTIGTRKILWCISGMHPWFAFQAILLMQIRRTQIVKKNIEWRNLWILVKYASLSCLPAFFCYWCRPGGANY